MAVLVGFNKTQKHISKPKLLYIILNWANIKHYHSKVNSSELELAKQIFKYPISVYILCESKDVAVCLGCSY